MQCMHGLVACLPRQCSVLIIAAQGVVTGTAPAEPDASCATIYHPTSAAQHQANIYLGPTAPCLCARMQQSIGGSSTSCTIA